MKTGAIPFDSIFLQLESTDRPTITINTTAAAQASAGTLLSAVDRIEMTWGRSSPRAHEGEGELKLTFRYHSPGVLRDDDEIVLRITVAGVDYVMPRHWVEDVTYTPRKLASGATVWVYDVVAVNAVARASGISLWRSSPLPAEQSRNARLESINRAAAMAVVDTMAVDQLAADLPRLGIPGPPGVAARDVEDANALEEIERVANTHGMVVTTVPAGLAMYPPWFLWLGMPTTTSSPAMVNVLRAGGRVAELPARAVQNQPRKLSRRSAVTSAKVSFQIVNMNDQKVREATWTHRADTRRPAGEASWETDWLETESDAAPRDPQATSLGVIAATARAIVREGGTPRPTLETARILLDRIPAGTLANWIAVVDRNRSAFVLYDAPADLDIGMVVCDATMTLEDGELSLEAGLQPSVLAGVRPFRWSDWPSPATAVAPTIPVRFSHLIDGVAAESISANDLRLVNGPTSWRK